MKRTVIFAISAILAGLGNAGTSQGASIVHGFSSTYATHGSLGAQEIPLFQGTDLDAVRFDWAASAGGEYAGMSVDPGPLPEVFYDGYAGFETGFDDGDLYSTGTDQLFSGTTSCGSECSASGEVFGSFYVPVEDIANFVGASTFEVAAQGYYEIVGLNNYSDFSYVSASGTVTYIYGVPEPATWAMMLVGLGMIGCTARRRQCVTLAYK